ncbi:hypothetical protein V1512DRAFT_262518 [Lipomyces arxii]|uniref:uncharacterized protein n=1 Tax=Lipomyces arxii TaxID=56418 RepID=UPI0034CFC4A5
MAQHSAMEDIHSIPTIPQSVRNKVDASKVILEPEHVLLPDGRKATVYAFFRTEDETNIEVCSSGTERVVVLEDQIDLLIATWWKIFNVEIETGLTYPQEELLEFKDFKNYWFSVFCAVMLLDSDDNLDFKTVEGRVLGTFYVKPNYPGRCGHVCNAGFLVSHLARGQGVGKLLGALYCRWAPKLGYSSSIFNLVFETNVASQRIWDGLGFDKIARVKQVAYVKGIENPVDAFIYQKIF